LLNLIAEWDGDRQLKTDRMRLIMFRDRLDIRLFSIKLITSQTFLKPEAQGWRIICLD
jgi:hypothetical protein